MPLVYVHFELSEVSDDDLINELDSRALCLSEYDRQKLLDAIKYVDADKWKLFLAAKDKFSVYELEEMFHDNTKPKAGKNQIAIEF